MTSELRDRAALLQWRPRLTARARLTIVYAGLLVLTGAIMLTIIYGFMRFVPTYMIDSPPIVANPGSPTGATTGDTTTGAVTPGLSPSITITSTAQLLNTLLFVSLITLVVLAVVGSWAGWIVAGRVLRPIQRVNEAARLAASGSLTHRVGLTGPRDEFTELSDTFDSMLERLDHSFRTNERFVANASHELRTPLAAAKTMLDVALANPETHDLRKLAERLRETNHRNIETVEALLDLSSVGQVPLDLHPVDLSIVVAEGVAEIAAEAKTRDIAISTSLQIAPTEADKALLRQAILNLLLNAVRHNTPHGTVSVTTQASDDQSVQVIVRNTGAPLADETLASLTEPFVRGRGRVANASGNPTGHGLGLALVESVVQAHQGTLRLSANPGGGLTATLTLPRSER